MQGLLSFIWAAVVVLLPHMLPSPFDEPIKTTEALLLIGLWTYISFRAFSHFGIFHFSLSVWSGISAVWLYIYPHYFWNGFGIATMSSFGSVVAGSFMFAAVISISGCLMPVKRLNVIMALIRIAAILDAIMICIHAIKGQPRYWIFDNPAMDATFIALFTGIRTKHFPVDAALWILSLVAINLTGSSTGLMVMSVACAAQVFASSEASAKIKSATIALLVLAFAGIGYLYLGKDLIDSSGRFHAWELAMKFWNQFVNRATGTGIGTFFLYGPGLQLTERVNEVKGIMDQVGHIQAFFWMHNDWLQILFELGIVGFVCAVGVAIKTLYVGFKNKHSNVFSIGVAYCAAMVTQFPLHHPITAFLCVVIVRLCFDPPEEKGEQYYHYSPTNEEYHH